MLKEIKSFLGMDDATGDKVEKFEMPEIQDEKIVNDDATVSPVLSESNSRGEADSGSNLKAAPTSTPVPEGISAFGAFGEIRREIASLWLQLSRDLNKDGSPDFPLLYENEPSKVVVMKPEIFGNPENWFFIGDIHADFFALHTLLNAIKKQCPDFRIVFMGDLFDRGEQPIECFFLLLKWAREHPERIIWLAGNHDIAFSYDKEQKQFVSSVRPSEFLDFLNLNDEMQSFRKPLGDFLIKLSAMLPRAVLFPDGLLATHGGFPLVDKQESAKEFSTTEEFMTWLNSPECLQDFTWTRITKYPKRAPNRSSKGCSYGFQDFESFCNLKPDLFPVKRMITGHEHPETGWQEFSSYKVNPSATICGFGFDYMLDSPAKFYKYKPKLMMAHYRKDQLPSPIEVDYSAEELHKFYPPPKSEEIISTASAEPSSVVDSGSVNSLAS